MADDETAQHLSLGALAGRWAELAPGVVVLAALVAGCGEPDAGLARATTTVDTVDGVVHVRHSGEVPVRELDPVLSLGEVGGLTDAPGPEEFGRVENVVGDADGRIYVADGLALEVRVFGPEGGFLRRLGRQGSGPGELEGLHGVAWLGDDTLVAVDPGNARLMRMTAAGEHVDQWPWLRISGSGRFFYNAGPRELYAFAIRAGGERGSRSTWVRYTPAGPVDSLDVPRLEAQAGSTVTCHGDGIGFFTNPFADRLVTTPAPAGERVVARASDYRLAFLAPAGDTVRILTRDIEPLPLPDSAWRRVEAEYREFREMWAGAACEGSIERPSHRPVLRAIFFSHDGRMLVEHTTTGGTALDLFEADGAWRSTIPLPPRDASVPPFLRGDRLYLSTRDTLGVQRVEVFGLRAPPG